MRNLLQKLAKNIVTIMVREKNNHIGVKMRRVVLPVVKAEYHDGGDHTARHRRHDAREVHA